MIYFHDFMHISTKETCGREIDGSMTFLHVQGFVVGSVTGTCRFYVASGIYTNGSPIAATFMNHDIGSSLYQR
jgi:hypothetical protein